MLVPTKEKLKTPLPMPKFLISGGGTGGHIFPAIAIANALKRARPDAEFLFVGAVGRMEMEKVPMAGFKIIGLHITGIKRSLSLANLAFPFRLLAALLRARQIIHCFKPDVVVGVGGFASGPVLRMATWMGVPCVIQEQNAFPGITNKWVAGAVQRVCVAYEGMEKFFPSQRLVRTGNPVRAELAAEAGKKAAALERFKLDAAKTTVLVVGGSLGASSINKAVASGFEQWCAAGLQVIWQTGRSMNGPAVVSKSPHALSIYATDFITEMGLAYAAADLVVSRAGAIAVSELCLLGKASVLVPYPLAAEDHQQKNAEALVSRGAAKLLKDADVGEQLVPLVLQLAANTADRESLGKAALAMATPGADDAIAREILNLLTK